MYHYFGDEVHHEYESFRRRSGERRSRRDGRPLRRGRDVPHADLQQGIDVFKLDDNGRVTDQTVWLRPWPVVTVLRDRAIVGKLPFLSADYWLLHAEPSHLP
jgi:hypothetical protein